MDFRQNLRAGTRPLRRAVLLLFLLAVLLPAAFFASCKGKPRMAGMDFPPTFLVESENRFAVVISPYAVLLDQPGEGGITLSHCRRGDVFAVSAAKLVGSGNSRSLWLCLDGGWILRDALVLFSSRAQAEHASRLILSGENNPNSR